VLQYAAIHNLSVGRRTDEILRVLAALQTGGLCPENWTEGQRPLDVTQTIGPGSVVGGFRIMERIGGGSFGAVFKAYDTTLERLVALKVLQSGDRDVIRQVLAEARAAAALQHAHVCTVYAVDNSEGMPLIAMEYVAGEALSKRLEAGPLDLEEARRLGRQVAEGMAAAHASGVIHGDLKPANIMVTHAGQAKIMDFGLARRERSRGMADATRSEMADSAGDEEPSSGLSGTPAYMSPEQTRGETLTPASDVFSFGLVLMEMLTGRRLFQSQRLLALFREIEDLNPDKVVERLAEPFRSLLRQALQPQVEQRTLTMADIAGILSIGRPG
jgi:serine/threonine protein kinase